MNPMPISGGLTHGSYVIIGNQMYVCGGFLTSRQDVVTNQCWLYTHTNPAGSQWSTAGTIPSLPQARGGGALLHHAQRNSLIFTSGTEKHDVSPLFDRDQVYEINLASLSTGWELKANPIPYKANRVSYATVNYAGIERQYVMGGQSAKDENWGNKKSMYEYVASTGTWIERSSLLFERGHFTSSTIPYKSCGIIIAYGKTNGGLTKDISYYNIGTDTWTKIGELTRDIKATVCDI